MRKIRDILRLRLAAGLTIRQINASTRVSIGAIQKLLTKAETMELTWPLPDDLDDNRLAQLFYPGTDTTVSSRYHVPDWPAVHQELKRKGMTQLLLWEEYTQQHPNRCYSYSQFLLAPLPGRSVLPKCSSVYWALPTTPMLKQH